VIKGTVAERKIMKMKRKIMRLRALSAIAAAAVLTALTAASASARMDPPKAWPGSLGAARPGIGGSDMSKFFGIPARCTVQMSTDDNWQESDAGTLAEVTITANGSLACSGLKPVSMRETTLVIHRPLYETHYLSATAARGGTSYLPFEGAYSCIEGALCAGNWEVVTNAAFTLPAGESFYELPYACRLGNPNIMLCTLREDHFFYPSGNH
jgi:hypothetical protein